MASNQAIQGVVRKLLAAPLGNKPNPAQGQDYTGWLTDLVSVFADSLRDVDDEHLRTAVREHIKKDKWFPSIADLLNSAEAVELRISEQASTGRGSRSFVAWAITESKSWPVCPECEEHTPKLDSCPFCADMQEAAVYNRQCDSQLMTA